MCASRRIALHLALGGRSAGLDGVDWQAVLECATDDRLITLAWLHSGEAIRHRAPDRIVAQWRAIAHAANAMAELQIEALANVVGALRAAGVRAVVLKGAPLALRLYGSLGARHCVDIDVYCAPDHRDRAREVLAQRGWLRIDASDAWEDTFASQRQATTTFLELHTAATGPNLAHLRVPPPAVRLMTIGKVTLPVHWDALTPAYLSAHLAKHRSPPLLWYLDLDRMWSLLTETERENAMRTAREVGLQKYLTWALESAQVVMRVGTSLHEGAGELAALLRAHRAHAMKRDVLLAQTRRDAARAFAAWVWPPALRHDPRRFRALCVSRLRQLSNRMGKGGHSLRAAAR